MRASSHGLRHVGTNLEMIMVWATGSVALGLLMTVLVIAELQQPVAGALKMPDRLFVAVTFAVAFVYAVILLASKLFV